MKGIKDFLQKREKDLAKTLLRKQFEKEGKPPPDERTLELLSAQAVDEANRIIKKRGRNVLEEFKQAARDFRQSGNKEK